MKKQLRSHINECLDTKIFDAESLCIFSKNEIFISDSCKIDFQTIANDSENRNYLFAEVKEPYRTIFNYFSENYTTIQAKDSESRMFLKEISVDKTNSSFSIIKILETNNAILIHNCGLLVKSNISISEAFVFFSTACFSLYVKFLYEYLYHQNELKSYQNFVLNLVNSYKEKLNTYNRRPILESSAKISNSIIEVGEIIVEANLVDSFFGNISYKLNNDIHITKTGSFLNKLENKITICNNDNYHVCKKEASSELPAHTLIYEKNNVCCIVHGHPRFSVIVSMICDNINCSNADDCYTKCRNERNIGNTPIVSGEVGDGKFGLYKTVPEKISNETVIVYGHGVFATGKTNFNEAFNNLLNTELNCVDEYLRLIEKFE
ncbi:MAG TPA: hypothetical protein DDX39_10550 [Bacteroidales bacterium]|nr:MAG: hypothetical protein A2W98_00750 [Bacteroidetes bacterium GWF2_33_38]HBF89070.1 hypothetical protein [Bacteroidales bacterium]